MTALQDPASGATQINTGENSAAIGAIFADDIDITDPADSPNTVISTFSAPAPSRITTITEPTDDVVATILSGETQNTRRCEIYEKDATTLWRPNQPVRLIEGNVTVSMDSDSRRTLDMVLDNSDGNLFQDPDNGFWYDKIIKVYRGIQFQPLRQEPKVAIIGGDPTAVPNTGQYLSMLGVSDFDFIFPPSDTGVYGTVLNFDPNNYDIICASSVDSNFSSDVYTLLKTLYSKGHNILTISNYATSASVPLIQTTVNKVGTAAKSITIPSGDSPFKAALQTYLTPAATAGEQNLTVVSAGVRVAANSASDGYVAVYQEASNDARWFHYQGKVALNPQNSGTVGYMVSDYSNQNVFLKNAMSWLFNYQPYNQYETQLGVFMIDSISEGNFPPSVSVTGRDLSKKLDLDNFDYATTYSAGSKVGDVLRGIALDAGITNVNISTDIGDGPQALLHDVSFSRDTKRLDAIKKICQGYQLQWFFNKHGVFTVRMFFDPTTSPTVLTIQTGQPNGNLISYTKTSDDSEMYNVVSAVALTGSKSDIEKWFYTAKNNDPNSPTSIARIGRRTLPTMTNALWKNADQVKRAAQKKLTIAGLEAFELSFESLIFPWLDAATVIKFVDPNDDPDWFPARFLLTDLAIPLALGTMTGTGKRILIVPDSNDL